MERKRTIFEDLRSFNFNRNTILILKMNSLFKSLGFERVNTFKNFDVHIYYPQMTLMLCPNLILNNNIDDDGLFSVKNVGTRTNNDIWDLWNTLLRNKKGYVGMNGFKLINESKEEIIPLTIEINDKKLILGHYLKERNIVMVYINLFNTDLANFEESEYLNLLLKQLEENIKRIGLKKTDVTEKMKLALLEQFKGEITNRIDDLKHTIIDLERNIGSYNSNLVTSMKSLRTNKAQIESLIGFSTKTDEVLQKEVKEVEQLPFVKNVKLTSNGISLDVGKVTINHKGEDVYMGDFYLSITPNEVKVYCKNPILSNDGFEVTHPHIDGNHNCYGGEREIKINEYLSSFELKKLVYFVYLFLKSYNANDSYNQISMWQRSDVKRRRTRTIKTEQDLSKITFLGDYYAEREDNGDGEDDDDNDEDDDNDDDYLGECRNCGNSVYEYDNNRITDDDGNHYCCNECQTEWSNRDR